MLARNAIDVTPTVGVVSMNLSKKLTMKKRFHKNAMLHLILSIVLVCSFSVYGQGKKVVKKSGEVTYISAQNVYTKFESTEGIIVGDTLFAQKNSNLQPAIIVQYISSKSCAGKPISNSNLELKQKVFAFVLDGVEKTEEVNVVQKDSVKLDSLLINSSKNIVKGNKSETKVPKVYKGRLSVYSYTDFTNINKRYDYQRWRYSFQYNNENLFNSGIEFSNYMTFAYKANEWQNYGKDLSQSLRVYDLSLNIHTSKKSNLWVGRHLNRWVSSLNSIDGLQYENSFGNFTGGLIVGSRPDFANMGFNIKLFEYGAFLARIDSIGEGSMENTFAAFQQTNDLKTDRRFIYFQHNNNILSNFNLFVSSEIDLYKREKGVNKNDFSLTSLYVSTRYYPSRVISFGVSYDARKNIIYYETFKSFIDSLYENETRQGLRFSTFIRPVDRLFIGLNAGYRFQKSDIKPSRNFGGYITYSQIPWLLISPRISYTKLLTSYTDGSTFSASLMKNFWQSSTSINLQYQQTYYKFNYNTQPIKQDIVSLDFSTLLFNSLFMSMSYEATFENERTYNRVLVGLSVRY